MDVREIITKLRGYGLELFVTDGVVHGRMRTGRMPFEARAWVDQLQMVNDQAAELILNEGVKEAIVTSMAEAKPLCDRFKRGEVELVGKVEGHECKADHSRDWAKIRYREAIK